MSIENQSYEPVETEGQVDPAKKIELMLDHETQGDAEMTKKWLHNYYNAHKEELNQMNSDERLAISRLFLSKGWEQLASYIMKGGGKKYIGNKDFVKEAATLERLLEEFETTYPLSVLYSIVDLNGADKDKAPMRTAARNALIPIVALLEVLRIKCEQEPGKSDQGQHDRLQARYKNCEKAAGTINDGKVRHN